MYVSPEHSRHSSRVSVTNFASYDAA